MKVFDWNANKHLLTDSTGRRLTIGLFRELSEPTAPFSLSDWRTIYVALADPTDYQAALALLGQWDHWQLLVESRAFMEHLTKWRREVDAKLRSEAIGELKKQSRTDKGVSAAKWLAEQGSAAKRGRPKKEEQLDEAQDRTRGDMKRLGLVQGGKL